MNRRGFLKAAVAAPWVITTAGLLMPVKVLAQVTPIDVIRASLDMLANDLEFVRAAADLMTFGTSAMRVEASPDGVTWRRVDPQLIMAPGGGIVKPKGTRHLQVDTIGMDYHGWHRGDSRVVHSGPDPLIIRSPGVVDYPVGE